MSSPPFAAVLLAGGRSRRMGSDKALLPLPDGRKLWERQLAVLSALNPAELFISGATRAGFPEDVTLLADEQPDLGPLGGITAALAAMGSSRLVVLAVDLPTMTTEFLRGLLNNRHDEGLRQGVVPYVGSGFFEPLAAVYPREALTLAEVSIHRADRSMQTFVRTLLAEGLVIARPTEKADSHLFVNWNRREDVQAPGG